MRFLFPLVLAVFLWSPVSAAEKAQKTEPAPAYTGGFEGPVRGAGQETAADALKLPNDSRVVLKGNIVARLGGERNMFVFKDDTGEIDVRITPRVFQNSKVTPEVNLRITGRIERDSANSRPIVRARQLEIIE